MTGRELLDDYKRSSKTSQTQLAERFDITPAYVSMLLSGERVVTGIEVAFRIERGSGGAVPASSWLHDLRERAAASARKPSRGAARAGGFVRRAGRRSSRRVSQPTR